jgi:hypothetical protein
MGRIEKTVFVSYRRTDEPWGLAIFQDLTQHGYDVFIDYDGIASGNFETVIFDNIRARAHFLVLLTPTALDRCDNPNDWMPEIEAALDSRRNIVPVMLSGFSFSTGSQLTGKLAMLNRYNGIEIPKARFFSPEMDRLRNTFLNVPVDAVLHPASYSARRIAKEQKVKAAAANYELRDWVRAEVREWVDRKDTKDPLPAPSVPAESPRSFWLLGGSAIIAVGAILALSMPVVTYYFAPAPKQSSPSVGPGHPSAAQTAPPPSTGVLGQTTTQPSTVVQSPAPVPPATPSAQPQPPSTPEDAADNARKVVTWKSITNQINGLSALLDNVASEANKWIADNSDSPAQSKSISEVLHSASIEFYNTRVDLELLSGSYREYPEIRDVWKEVRRSPGAAPIPGNLFDRLQRSLDFDSSVSKDIATPYVETMLSNIKDFKEWQRTTSQKAPR